MATGDVHTYPTGDVIEHVTDGRDCPCGPQVVPVQREDGSMGWQIIHHLVGESES